MTPAEIHQKLVAKFGDKITGANLEALDPWIEVAPASIADVADFRELERGGRPLLVTGAQKEWAAPSRWRRQAEPSQISSIPLRFLSPC